MGKGNEEKPGLSAGMGPFDLGGLYALKGGTLRWVFVVVKFQPVALLNLYHDCRICIGVLESALLL